jgi:hypothetical protein
LIRYKNPPTQSITFDWSQNISTAISIIPILKRFNWILNVIDSIILTGNKFSINNRLWIHCTTVSGLIIYLSGIVWNGRFSILYYHRYMISIKSMAAKSEEASNQHFSAQVHCKTFIFVLQLGLINQEIQENKLLRQVSSCN